ncbi:MAG: hypothetical protein WBA28_05695 [Microbacteriaceae bacterium]
MSRSATGSVFVVSQAPEKWSKKLGPLVVAVLILGILYYAVPYLMNFLDLSAQAKPELILLVMVNPIAVMILNLLYSSLFRYGWVLVLLSGALAVPSFYLHYNSSAMIYAALYAIVAALGWGLGLLIRSTRKRPRN